MRVDFPSVAAPVAALVQELVCSYVFGTYSYDMKVIQHIPLYLLTILTVWDKIEIG